jgi:hypothetical protein
MMINKKLALAVASALAMSASGVASAADVDATPLKHSSQGLQFVTSTTTVESPIVDIVLKADYTLNDTITIVIAGATINATAANPSFECTDDNAIISFVQRVGGTYTYRVTQKDVANTTDLACVFGDASPLVLNAASIAGTVTLTYSATTAVSNLPLDTGPDNTAELHTVSDQFASEVDEALNATIDVEADRLEFVEADDTLSIDVTDIAATLDGVKAALRSVTTVVNGNFSYVDAGGDEDGTCEAGELAGAISAVGGTLTIASNCQSITILDNDGAATDISVTFDENGAVLQPQSFTATTTFAYDDGVAGTADKTESDNYSAGRWTLNGASVYVNYMPYGANISQIIYAANKGTQSGEITIDAFNQAGTTCSFTAGTLAAGKVAQLSGAVKTGLEGCYGAGFSDRVAMTITVNVPADDVEVYSAYNVGGSDRGTVVNDSNGRKAVVAPF